MKVADFLALENDVDGYMVLHVMCCNEHQQHRPVINARTARRIGAQPDYETGEPPDYRPTLAYVHLEDHEPL